MVPSEREPHDVTEAALQMAGDCILSRGFEVEEFDMGGMAGRF